MECANDWMSERSGLFAEVNAFPTSTSLRGTKQSHTVCLLFYLLIVVGTVCKTALAIVYIRASKRAPVGDDWCCAKSPDFVPIAICRTNFSKLYFPVFVDY